MQHTHTLNMYYSERSCQSQYRAPSQQFYIEIKRAFGHMSPQGRVGRETDYVVSMHPTPPRTIHPPHQIANNP